MEEAEAEEAMEQEEAIEPEETIEEIEKEVKKAAKQTKGIHDFSFLIGSD